MKKYIVITLLILCKSAYGFAQKTIRPSTTSFGEQKLLAVLEMRPQDPMSTNIKICSPSRHLMEKPPLFILDGMELTHGDSLKIDPKAIESIKVINNKKAIEPYGRKGENGVIIITSKKK